MKAVTMIEKVSLLFLLLVCFRAARYAAGSDLPADPAGRDPVKSIGADTFD